MRYKGTLFEDLQSTVDACLQSRTRVCAICEQSYGAHSQEGTYCPDPADAGVSYLKTTFAEGSCTEESPSPAQRTLPSVAR